MDEFKSYDLSSAHSLRYFWPDPNPARLLKRIRNWIKESDADVESIDIKNHYDTEQEALVFEATVTYFGVN